jgi:hypothetical protein
MCTVIFYATTCYVLGKGEQDSFWKDRWLNGYRVFDIALNVVKLASSRSANSRSVKDGLTGLWLNDVMMDLGSDPLAEFFLMWHRLVDTALISEHGDVLVALVRGRPVLLQVGL